MSDAETIHAVLAGQHERFRDVVERHFVAVYALCMSYLKEPANAEDAAQDTFVRCYNGLDTLRHSHKFPPWLMSTARNICLDQIRADARRKRLERALAEEP